MRFACGGFVVSDSTHASGTRLTPHRHPFACVHVVLEGCYAEVLDGAPVRVAPGVALVKRAGVEHSNDFGSESARTLRVEIHRPIDELDRAIRRSQGTAATIDSPQIRALAARLRGRLRDERRSRDLAAEGICLEMVAALVEESTPQAGGESDTVRRSLEQLQQTFRTSSPLGAIADTLEIVPSRLSRLVRKATGRSLGEHLREMRVRWVAQRLREGDETVGALSLAAGFADQSHCVRVFRRVTGLTPSAYRATMGRGVQGVQGGRAF